VITASATPSHHIDHGVVREAKVADQQAHIEASKHLAAANVADIDQRIGQIDSAVAKVTKRWLSCVCLCRCNSCYHFARSGGRSWSCLITYAGLALIHRPAGSAESLRGIPTLCPSEAGYVLGRRWPTLV
jgi:hypothetical protein